MPVATATTRLRREDFWRTKHDSAFSTWKILIGELDWEDNLRGKEGVERYRTQNLPNLISCSGVYELGIPASYPRSRQGTRKLHSNSVICVYVGQADNLRSRLQRYGRDGAHLESGRSIDKSSHIRSESLDKGLGFFTDIFSRGFPIVYRSAPMNSKMDAERTEKQLLDRFDYAWNKGNNGARRHDDICKKLDHLSVASKFSLIVKRFADSLHLYRRKVGIKIKGRQPNAMKMSKPCSVLRIFGIKRVQQNSCDDSATNVCGVAMGNGSICKARPIEGRQRCSMHKGMKVNGYISKFVLKEECVCGFRFEDGVSCQKKPVGRNKRCWEHKGRRMTRTKG